MGADFTPLGVVQGWSPGSMAEAARSLVAMGYEYLALGGMVPLKSPEIKLCLQAIREAIPASTRLHILGFAKADDIDSFHGFDIASFDTTSPLIRAFKDAKQNYYLPGDGLALRYYTSIRVPQAIENPKLQRAVKKGIFRAEELVRLEALALGALRAFDRGEADLEETLRHVLVYSAPLVEERPYEDCAGSPTLAKLEERYRVTLRDRPWKDCGCGICEKAAIDVIIFRGSNRNKRRGIARPAGRIATDVNHARNLRRGDLGHLFACAGAGRIEHDGSEPVQLVWLERIAEQVAVHGMDRRQRPARSLLAGQVRAPVSLRGEHLAPLPRQRESKGAKPGKQVRNKSRPCQPLLCRADQRRLAIGGRLQERAGRQGHGNAAKRHGDRFRLPHRFGAVALIDGEPGNAARLCEVEQGFGRLQPFDRQSLDAEVDALVGEGHFQIDGKALALLAGQHLAQRRNEREQFRAQHMAFCQVDDSVRSRLAKADDDTPGLALSVKRGAAAALRWGEMRGSNQRRLQPLSRSRIYDARGDEFIEGLVVAMLQLASTASSEVAARRRGMMGARL